MEVALFSLILRGMHFANPEVEVVLQDWADLKPNLFLGRQE